MKKYPLPYADTELIIWKCDRRIAFFTPYCRDQEEIGDGLDGKPDAQYPEMNGFSVYDLNGSAKANDKGLNSLRKLQPVAIGTHIYHEENSDEPLIPNGKIYVLLTEDVNLRNVRDILVRNSLRVDRIISKHEFILEVTAEAHNPVRVARHLLRYKAVIKAQPDFIMPKNLNADVVPPALLNPNQWYLHDSAASMIGPALHANVLTAWDFCGSCGTDKAILAMVDEGFDNRHAELAPGHWYQPYDASNPGAESGQTAVRPDIFLSSHEPTNQRYWHGTLCAGVAIGQGRGNGHPSSGVFGAAPNARFMPIRTSASLCSDELVGVFNHAIEHKADIVSCSWELNVTKCITDEVRNKISYCAEKGGQKEMGALVFVSAGNGSGEPGVLAQMSSTRAIGAVDDAGRRLKTSKAGYGLWMTAPAGDPSQHLGMYTTDFTGRDKDSNTPLGMNPGAFSTKFGLTSGATALTAGIAAMLVSLWPERTPADIANAMRKTARPAAGVPTGDGNGYNYQVGYGIVDAHAAARYLWNRFEPPTTNK